MKRAFAAIALSAALLTACSLGTPAEDSPAWNCHTMGNHICGRIER